MRNRTFMAAVAAGGLALFGVTVPQSIANAGEERTTYIVQLADPPLASYRGGVEGIPATSPAATRGADRLDTDSAASQAYLTYLKNRQTAVRTAASTALGRDLKPAFSYRYAYNGMALSLTATEADRLERVPGVTSVQEQFVRKVESDAGPEWIGAPAVWSGDATGNKPGTKGEGVVVGVIDTGINHDHPSFADIGGDGHDHENPRGKFYGLCDPVTGAPLCTDKLIGVYDFSGTGPNDEHGHGSHTASTAAGNHGTAVVKAPTMDLKREISGVAPHANVISYKGCTAVGSCLSPSLVMAIDQATADGVDVINYSIGGGSNDPWSDADAQAFLAAREAGVFVATSAGNSGPKAETIGSPADSPWLLSVGASTHDRAFVNSLTALSGGSGTPPGDLSGKGLTSGYGPATIVHAKDYGDAICSAPFLPGTFDGEIVVCDRGVIARVEKGRNVKAGGAGGMVLVNTEAEGESTVADPHHLPALHLGFTDGEKLATWMADGEGHTATIAGTTADEDPANGDVMAGFSSRGANPAVPGVVKPDVTAPGVDVLAAAGTPTEYTLMSGTSMSSPHAAGAAALVRAVHPDWTPAEVQSAMTSTGVTDVRKDDGSTAADPFDMGGGRVDLTRAAEAGLVLDVSSDDYRAADPASGNGDPTRLNLATLGHGDCVGRCTWTRTVRNALDSTEMWRATTNAPAGVDLSVKPNRFRLAPGESVTLTVTADVMGADSTDWMFGAVNLTAEGRPNQRFPVAVKPGGAATEVDIAADATSGTHQVTLTAPVDLRDISTAVYGLQQGRLDEMSLEQDPTPLDPYDTQVGTRVFMVDVEAGSRFLATGIADTTATDLDLFVGRDTNGDGAADGGEEMCRSASETAMESCRITSPQAGTYWVMVQNWLAGRGVDDVSLQTAVVPGSDNGNLTAVAPSQRVRAGEEYPVDLAWNEPQMEPGTVWYAMVLLGTDADHLGNLGSLMVRIERS